MAKRKQKSDKPSGAQKGNKNATALKDPEIRQKAFKHYLEWLALGRAKESWYYDDGSHHCGYLTMKKYIRENPDEFDPELIEIAESKRFNLFWQYGMDMMLGKYEKCQPAIFQMFMRNVFGWDKQEKNTNETNRPLVERLLDYWERGA